VKESFLLSFYLLYPSISYSRLSFRSFLHNPSQKEKKGKNFGFYSFFLSLLALAFPIPDLLKLA